jgi:hypothetical protein
MESRSIVRYAPRCPSRCITHHVRMVKDCEKQTEMRPDLQSRSYRRRSEGCDLNWKRRVGSFKTGTTKQAFQFGVEGRRCPTPGHFLPSSESKDEKREAPLERFSQILPARRFRREVSWRHLRLVFGGCFTACWRLPSQQRLAWWGLDPALTHLTCQSRRVIDGEAEEGKSCEPNASCAPGR